MPEKIELKTEKFIENRQPGLVLDKFDFEEDGEKKQAVLRYIKTDDLPGFAEVIKARWKERAEMSPEETPEISESEIKEIEKRYNGILSKCQEQGLDYFKNDLKVIEESFCDPQRPLFIIATVDEKIVGYIEIGYNIPDRDREAIWVHTISLLPEYQGKKIKTEDGQKLSFSHLLLERGIAEARKEEILKDRKKVALGALKWRPRAIKFWTKEYFKQEEPLEEEKKTFGPHSIKMVKYL